MADNIKKTVILYHAGCRDGFGAAWAAWKKFGAKATYIPVEYHNLPPAGLKGKEIYTLDFTYKRPITEKLMRENKSVTSIDHHESQKEITGLTENYSYAVNHSGSVLAWKYFHPGKRTPFFLKCVEDSDIWKWKIPHSREILVYADLFPTNFKTWSKIVVDLDNKKRRKKYINSGIIILRYYSKLVEYFVSKAEKVRFLGRTVYAANVPGEFRSDVGHLLAKKMPPFAIVWREERGRIGVSLRSNGGADVSKIAVRFGGGGHKNAAAFAFGFGKKIPWKILKK